MRPMLNKITKLPLWQPALVVLAGEVLAVLLIPPEQTLGTGIRLIYFHGTWIWTGIGLSVLAAIFGLIAVALRKETLHRISAALGRSGLVFLLTYLPMAMLVMKLVWNGFFFTEPRWSIPFSLTIACLLFQVGVLFVNQRVLTSLANLSFGVILVYNLTTLKSVLHPDSPVFTSQSGTIWAAFILLYFFIFCGGLLLTLWLYRIAPELSTLGKK